MAAGLRNTLLDLGYPQPATYILVDNEVASGVTSNTIEEPKRTKSVDMQFHCYTIVYKCKSLSLSGKKVYTIW